MRPTIDASSVSLPGQQGIPLSYITASATQAWQRSVYLDDIQQDDFTAAMVWLPGNPDFAVEKTPWVIYCHGATANEQQPLIAGNGMDTMLDSWLDLGWGVVSLRLGTTGVTGPTTDNDDGKWGNNPTRDGAIFVYDWITSFCSLPDRGLLFYGFSAGGTNALNIILEWSYRDGIATVPVAAVALVDPAVNLRYAYDRGGEGIYGIPGVNGSSARIRAQIKAAYEIPNSVQSGELDWVSRIDDPRNGHDLAEIVDIANFPTLPVLVSASTGDTLIRKAYHADLFVASLTTDGRWPSMVELAIITTSGGHGRNTHFTPSVHNAFFERALAR